MDPLLHNLLRDDWDNLAIRSTTSSNSAESVMPPSSDDLDSIDHAEDADEGSHISKKRKVAGKRQNARSGDRYDIGAGQSVAQRHDLRDIAARGGGGRVMFMFEKVSKSKM